MLVRKASIVSIGNEILSGLTVDTNAAYLSRELVSIGIAVVSSYTVGDQIDLIVWALESAGADADVVLVTGGLGPTDDDLTRQGFAEYLGSELQLQEGLFQEIQFFFARLNLQMPAKNKVQAYIPAGTESLANNLGTAPGIMARVKDKLFFAVPGVPAEMRQMFEESVLPQLKGLATEQAIVSLKLKCVGAGESRIAELIGELCRRDRNPVINFTVEFGVVTLHIIATAEDEEQARGMVEKDEQLLRSILGDLIYGTEEQTLAEVVGKKLAEQKKTVAVAESCTGGSIAKLLTDVPGASRYFTHGWVTYSNLAKAGELGVSADLIEKYGAVSEQVAEAMARAGRKKADTTFAIGITGIAGPGGGSEQKPVGLVYISVDSDNGCETKRFIFSHTSGSQRSARDIIRQRAAQKVLNMLRLKLYD